MTDDAIQMDASNNSPEQLYLDKWTLNKPSDNNNDDDEIEADENEDFESDDANEDLPSDDEDENDENGETDEESSTETKYADDDASTKIKVDGKEIEVKVSDLKRLYGQEAALTRKSQEVAEKRKQYEEFGTKAVAAADVLMRKAQERFKPYQDINWFLAAKELPSDEFAALQNEALSAAREVQYFEQEVSNLIQTATQFRQQELVQQVQITNNELSDPKNGIPNWSRDVYDNIREYATKTAGIPDSVMDTVVDSNSLKIIYKAMMYDKGQAVKTNVVKKSPTKIVKTSNVSTTPSKTNNNNKAVDRLKKTGSLDDAAAAFLSRWKDE